jgi:hypothetical protein
MSRHWRELLIPPTWSQRTRRAFRDFARQLSYNGTAAPKDVSEMKRAASRSAAPGLKAATHVLDDLAKQGWQISMTGKGGLAVSAPEAEADPAAEKARVQRQELLKRDEQLSSAPVRRFVAEMEMSREFRGNLVSIFTLMRDGADLAARLKSLVDQPANARPSLRTIIDPYVQVISNGDRCPYTGLRLMDVWRYFRHTWTNQYSSTPGRTMLLLVRDRAAPNHPVVGIAALASPIVQIAERDEWIGWQPQRFLARLAESPTLSMARWIVRRLEIGLKELHLDDLIEDGLYWPSMWETPTREAVDRLLKESRIRRLDHHRFARRSDLKATVRRTGVEGDQWRERAESDLFRSKRCLALADLLDMRIALGPLLDPKPTARGLRRCVDDPVGRRAIAGVLRRAKAEVIGTEIADLSVCGAIAPYNSILGGKLVSMLAVSPTVVRAYHERYGSYAGEIASSLAGRPIRRRSHLVFVGTTSLYGSGSSQYNRLRIPASVLNGRADVVFRPLGRSRSFGTSHLSKETVSALVQLAEQSRTGIRINSIFGEGVNPKLRKVRHGLDLLGWPSDELLQHRRPRIVYGVSLVDNLFPYLLGLDERPRYAFRPTIRNDVESITNWWCQRWADERIKSDEVLARVAVNSLDRPVLHGARVRVPVRDQEEEADADRLSST